MTVRLATWNLERGGRTRAARAAQTVALADQHAEVIVYTEPGSRFRAGPGVVTSPPTRPRSSSPEPWIAIVGAGVEPVLDIPYKRLAVAARVILGGQAMIVYGTVLPWLTVAHHAPEVVATGESSFDTLVRVLQKQVDEIAELGRVHAMPGHLGGGFQPVRLRPHLRGLCCPSEGARPSARPLGHDRMERRCPTRAARAVRRGPDLRTPRSRARQRDPNRPNA